MTGCVGRSMPLQNRVTPTGDIIATPHRGLFTGNRGIIHDPATKTLLNRSAGRAGLAHLRLRIPRPAARGDGAAELDRAVLSRRGHRASPPGTARASSAAATTPTGFARRGNRATAQRSSRARDRRRAASRAARSGKKRLHPAADAAARIARRRDGAGGRRELSDRAGQGAAVVAGRLSRGAHAPLESAMLLTPPSTLRALRRDIARAASERAFEASLLKRSGPFSSTLIRDSRSVQSRTICRQRCSKGPLARRLSCPGRGLRRSIDKRELFAAIRASWQRRRDQQRQNDRRGQVTTALFAAAAPAPAPSAISLASAICAASAPCRNWWWRRCCSFGTNFIDVLDHLGDILGGLDRVAGDVDHAGLHDPCP
jgi:hypothetical protein